MAMCVYVNSVNAYMRHEEQNKKAAACAATKAGWEEAINTQ